ncbi:MAG: FAD:protein FMN transferase [Oscillospiraceae bacterium]|jgi:thiamine biosynthesis lipoprotein|nr:FAD:protein FMN transferase [Oscillospiraceae bacterium]
MKNARLKKASPAAALVILALLSFSCAQAPESWSTAETFALDTIITVRTLGAARETAAEVAGIAADTELFVLQTGGDIPEILDTASLVSDITNGALDLTLTPVLNAWGFGISGGEHRVPSDGELAELLASRDPSALDVGSAAKGYALGLAGEKFLALSESGACGVLNFGGSILAIGKKPDGSRLRLGIENPRRTGDTLGGVAAENLSVTASGSYQRYFEADGVRYHHILDPKTGKPADSGLSSVVVVCADPLLGDCLSTALFVLGKDEAVRSWREYGAELAFELLFVDAQGSVFVTERLASGWSTQGFGSGANSGGYAAYLCDNSFSVIKVNEQ